MKWLCIAGLICFGFSPSWAETSDSHHYKHPQPRSAKGHARRKSSQVAAYTTHGSGAPRQGRLESESARKAAGFHTASFSPATTDQTNSASHTSKKKPSKKKRGVRRPPTQMAPTADRVSEIQSALSRGGYYKGDATGKLDADTTDALQRFQAANGLDSTGKLDALTLQKLGLGSDIAGVSAPKGITSHSCCSISPSPSLAPRRTAAPNTVPIAQAGSPSAAASPAENGPGDSSASASSSSAH